MINILIGIICLFIGWNMKQPQWAKNLQDKFFNLFRTDDDK